MTRRLRISVLTACTGLKVEAAGPTLSRSDFLRGPNHVARLHRRLTASLVPAEGLYRGQQHVRLMRGVKAARDQGHRVSVSIVSAGYGLLAGGDAVAPYECTFQGMSSRERRDWADRLSLKDSIEELLAQTADIAIVLLGDDYFSACSLAGEIAVGAPTIVLCGARTGLRIQPAANVLPVVLHERDTRRFACGLVGLKGEVAGRLLGRLASDPVFCSGLAPSRLLDELAQSPLTRETALA